MKAGDIGDLALIVKCLRLDPIEEIKQSGCGHLLDGQNDEALREECNDILVRRCLWAANVIERIIGGAE